VSRPLAQSWVSYHDTEAEAAENAIDALQKLQASEQFEFVAYRLGFDLKQQKHFLEVEYFDLIPDGAA
jgi:ribulose bisphosphate carboxylase small subunit